MNIKSKQYEDETESRDQNIGCIDLWQWKENDGTWIPYIQRINDQIDIINQ